jgi:predicted dehydrogenase/threonine dehydrogenase-like Zn-dependent dehydrogenase
MRQVLQDLTSGETRIIEAPTPSCSTGHVLVRSTVSLISAGTERMLVGFGRAGYIEKARQQPEKVRMVMGKVRADGLLTTLQAVQSKLSQPLPLGYSNVGVVLEVGDGIDDLHPGDRVVSNGAHADIVKVPRNLCARIPTAVTDENAAFVVVGSIGLQGIRLAMPTLGEAFVVTGVGLVGLLTVQLLRAHGCRVLAIDFDDSKLKMARAFGAETCNLGDGEDPVASALAFSRGVGVDGVLITASTRSSDPVTQAARMCRKRGRIVLVGVAGLQLNRADFYEKELTLQVSCSYGPGRYDAEYEEGGHDYPVGFVRWTERRNFEAVLDMMASGAVQGDILVTHRFPFEDSPKAYKILTEDKAALGMLLRYESPEVERLCRSVKLQPNAKFGAAEPVLGFVGAGNYASRMLIPAFKAAGGRFHTIVTAGGINGVIYGGRAGFAVASTDVDAMLSDSAISAVVIVTRHDSHARLAARSLEAGKHVFVEKPLAIDAIGLRTVRLAYDEVARNGEPRQIMIGFNRRFAPHVRKMKALLTSVREPKSFIMTINAGAIPPEHWTQDPTVGGGRIIGEACHFIDLMRHLAGCKVVAIQARRMGTSLGIITSEDKASITLGFEDGSFGTILYLSNGSASFPKERIEVFTAGRVLQLDNFRKLTGFGWSGFSRMNLWRQDKGQKECASAFLEAVKTGRPAIAPDEIFEVAEITLQAAELLRRQ